MSIFSSDSRTNWAQAFISGIPYAAFSSMQVVEIGQGFVTLLLPARATWTGDTQRNLIHAGCLSVLADTACGLAVGSAMEEMEPFATLDLRDRLQIRQSWIFASVSALLSILLTGSD